MFEIFKTVLFLSMMGAGMILLLLLLKPLTVKKFPARWQSLVWLTVTVCMVLPVWKWIPIRDAQELMSQTPTSQGTQNIVPEDQDSVPIIMIEDTPMAYREIPMGTARSIRIYDLLAYVWFGGMCIFLTFALGSYFLFLRKKRRNSLDLKEYTLFEDAKRELHIKRNIRVRVSNAPSSPMLVGTFFPVIYVPGKTMDDNAQRLIFLHELTHYKHGDLLFKWLTLFVNGIHWFNPFAYLLSANVSESCEVACDMSVIKRLDEQEQKLYMNTILDLIEQENRR